MIIKLIFYPYSPADASTNISCPENVSAISVAESTSSISGPEITQDNINETQVEEQDINKATDDDENVSCYNYSYLL